MLQASVTLLGPWHPPPVAANSGIMQDLFRVLTPPRQLAEQSDHWEYPVQAKERHNFTMFAVCMVRTLLRS